MCRGAVSMGCGPEEERHEALNDDPAEAADPADAMDPAATRVLVVCTANRCRSPFAAALLADKLAGGAPDVAVSSAGFLNGGEPVPDTVSEVAEQLGIDLRTYRSRQVTPAMLQSSDLVIAMERAHVRELAMLVPEAWRRTFTLPELQRRASACGPRPAREPLDDWLRLVHGDRRLADLLGEASFDEVADPMGGPRGAYMEMAADLDELTTGIVALLWPWAA